MSGTRTKQAPPGQAGPGRTGRSTIVRVARHTGIYVVSAAGVWQAADVAFEALGLPDRAITLLVIGAIALLPVVVVVSWATSPPVVDRLSTSRLGMTIGLSGAAAALVGIAVAVLAFRGDVRPAELPPDMAMAAIREAAFAGEIADGVERADRIAERDDIPRELKVEAYRHVARAAVRAGDTTAARSTLDHMLALEPPLILLHPAVESADLIALYTAARRARVSSAAAPVDLEKAAFSVGPMAVVGLDLEQAEALRTGIIDIVITVLARDLTVVERGTGMARRLVDVDLVDPEDFYRVFDDVSAGRFPGLRAATHAVTGSLGVSGDRVLVTLWAMDLRSGAIAGHGLAEGDWPADGFGPIDEAARSLVADLRRRLP